MRLRRHSGADIGTRQVVIVAGLDTQILDVAGPVEVFSRCARLVQEQRGTRSPGYRVKLVSAASDGSPIKTTSGVELGGSGSYNSVRQTPDTLLIAGGGQIESISLEREFVSWLQKHGRKARRVGSICTGSFALGAAGLLDHRRCTTHWAFARRLQAAFPKAVVDPDPIWLRDGNVLSSAGVTAGMDLALALVEEDFGVKMALQIARELVLYLRRPGTQSQFSASMAAQLADREPIRDLQLWLPDHLDHDLRCQSLADRAGMSVRNFARVFSREVGMTAGEYVDRLRVEAACVRLAGSSQGVQQVAAQTGFHSADVMRRTMLRVIRITPEQYRLRFGKRR